MQLHCRSRYILIFNIILQNIIVFLQYAWKYTTFRHKVIEVKKSYLLALYFTTQLYLIYCQSYVRKKSKNSDNSKPH